jgi:hypothetical protein
MGVTYNKGMKQKAPASTETPTRAVICTAEAIQVTFNFSMRL